MKGYVDKRNRRKRDDSSRRFASAVREYGRAETKRVKRSGACFRTNASDNTCEFTTNCEEFRNIIDEHKTP
ncbi:MAG: hypothetical protein WB988_18410 [Candidatus Nitrosopolaris sp.]